MKRCAWCEQEMSNLTPVFNRDTTTSQSFDFVCLACAEVERFEHADKVTGNPIGFVPAKYRRVRMTASLDDRIAS